MASTLTLFLLTSADCFSSNRIHPALCPGKLTWMGSTWGGDQREEQNQVYSSSSFPVRSSWSHCVLQRKVTHLKRQLIQPSRFWKILPFFVPSSSDLLANQLLPALGENTIFCVPLCRVLHMSGVLCSDLLRTSIREIKLILE